MHFVICLSRFQFRMGGIWLMSLARVGGSRTTAAVGQYSTPALSRAHGEGFDR